VSASMYICVPVYVCLCVYVCMCARFVLFPRSLALMSSGSHLPVAAFACAILFYAQCQRMAGPKHQSTRQVCCVYSAVRKCLC